MIKLNLNDVHPVPETCKNNIKWYLGHDSIIKRSTTRLDRYSCCDCICKIFETETSLHFYISRLPFTNIVVTTRMVLSLLILSLPTLPGKRGTFHGFPLTVGISSPLIC